MSTEKIHPAEYLFKVGVPKKFCGVTFDSYESGIKSLKLSKAQTARYLEIVRYARKIIQDGVVGFFFFGSNGCGKTSLANAALREALLHDRTVARCTAQEVLNWYFDGYKGMRPRYLKADHLLIEELNKEVDLGSQHSLKIIESLIKTREESGKLTSYTTNCDSEALLDKYGETVYNIVKGTTVSIEFPAVDIREIEVKSYVEKLK